MRWPIGQVPRKIKRLLFGLRAVSTFPNARITTGMIRWAARKEYVASRRGTDPERPFTRENADTCEGEKKKRTEFAKGAGVKSEGARDAFGTVESLARSDSPESSYPTRQVGGGLTFSTAPDPAVREERLRPRSSGRVLVEASCAATESEHVDVAQREARQRTRLG